MNIDNSSISNVPEGPTRAAAPVNTTATATERQMMQALFGVDLAEGGYTIVDDAAVPTQAQGKGAAVSAKALAPAVMAGGKGIEADEEVAVAAPKVSQQKAASASSSASAVAPARNTQLNHAQQELVTSFAETFTSNVKLQSSIAFVDKNVGLLPPDVRESYTTAKESVSVKEQEYFKVSQQGTELAKTPGTPKQELEAIASQKKEIGKTLVELKNVPKSAHKAILEHVGEHLMIEARNSKKSDLPFRADSPQLTAFNDSWKAACRDNGLSGEIDKTKAGFKDPFAKAEAKGKDGSPRLRADIRASLKNELRGDITAAEKKVINGIIPVLDKETKTILKTIVSHLDKTKDPGLQSLNTLIKETSEIYQASGNEHANNPAALTTNAFCLRVLAPQLTGDMSSSHNISLGNYLQDSANLYLAGALKDSEMNGLFESLTRALIK